MQVGMFLIFQGDGHGLNNEQMVQAEIAMAIRAEDLGFDSVWVPEHYTHNSYSISGDPTQLLTYIAAKTNHIKLGTAGIILPWWDPLRVVHNISLVDILSEGRLLVGFGRGLAPREYRAFRVDMSESRERFNEASEMIVRSLETGFIEGDGQFFKQPKVEIHPASPRSFRDRIFSIAVSPGSAEAAADLGATLMMFVRQDAEHDLPVIEQWRARFQEKHGRAPASPPIMLDFTYCHEDKYVAEQVTRKYLTSHFKALEHHYSWAGDQWEGIKGYENYAAEASAIQDIGIDAAADEFINQAAWGTPAQVIEKIMSRREVIGDYSVMLSPTWGGLPYDLAHESMSLVSKKVLPELREIGG
jgi:alkanesulfonate monooxygenase SsuD/methylene tetrahydromethanopterin reductase-like flavin-dependent oxidoreductase (luciferase family)